MPQMVTYGDISPRTAAYVVKDLLDRTMPYMMLEKFGQAYPIPTNSTKTAKWRRYFLSGATGTAGNWTQGSNWYVPLALTPLVEGVTPAGRRLATQDYTAELNQYGDYIVITDVVEDTHEDPVLKEAIEIISEQAALTIETVRFNILKAGTNVFYANGSARTDVNTALSLTLQRQITSSILRQNGKMITSVIASTPNFRTEPVEAAIFALCHPDLETDVRSMQGYINPKQYGQATAYENEIGAVERVRYLTTTIMTPWADIGGAKGAMRSTSGTLADVYPVFYFAKNAYGIVPLKGKSSITPMVVSPKAVAGDPLAQRGTVGWKAWQSAVILQDAFFIRAEVAATA